MRATRHSVAWRDVRCRGEIIGRLTFGLLIVYAALVAMPAASASTWNGLAGNSLWNSSGNWSGGVPNATGAVADFSTLDITAETTVHMNGAETVGTLLFGDTTPGNDWILDNNGNGADILTLAVSSGSPTITVNNDTATISAVVAGTQGLAKSGAGALILGGNNTYSGTTTISAGTLRLDNANGLGNTAAGTTIGSGATLDLRGQAVGAESLTISGTGVGGNGALVNIGGIAASLSGTVTAGAAFTVGGTGDIVLSGSVNGGASAFVLTKVGGNTLTLSGNTDNINLGATVNSGTLMLGKTSSHSPDVHAIGQATVTVAGGTAQLGGTGGDQIYDLGAVAVTSGAFDANGRSESFATLSLQGTGIAGAGALVNTAAAASTITPTNGTTLTADTIIGVTQSGGSLTLNNAIGGNFGITKVGNGTLALAGNNTFTGGVTINAGNLQLGNPGALNSSSPNSVTFGPSSVGTLSLNGKSVTIGALNGATSSTTVQNSSASAATLTLTVDIPIEIDSLLQNGGAGALSLTKTGAATLTLGGNNSYTGSTSIDGGTVILGNAFALGSTAGGTTIGDGTLDLGGQAVGESLIINGTGVGGDGALFNGSASAASVSGTVTVGGGCTIGGSGDITLSGSVNNFPGNLLAKAGNNILTLSGTTDDIDLGARVNGGTLILAKTSSNSPAVHAIGQETLTVAGGIAQLGGTGGDQIYDLGNVVVTSGAFDTSGRNETFASLSLQGTGIAGAGALVNSAAAASTITPTNGTTLTANATIGVMQSGGSLTLNNPIGGNFGITKVGAGTLIFPNANTFSGGLTVQNGTLQVLMVNNAGTNGPLGNNTSVALGTAGQSGAGQPIGTLEYTGGTTSSTMPFTTPTSNGAIQIDNASANLTLTGTVGVSGEFIKAGPGTLTLTANPTFSANSLLLVNGGTLRYNNSGAATIGTGVSATVASDGTLELAGSFSALSSGLHRVNISNSSSSPGLLVSGTHQQFGNVDGSGTTRVNAGSDLTANHIVQSALVIGGTLSTHGLVTIAPSDASGNPLGQAGAGDWGLGTGTQSDGPPDQPSGLDSNGLFSLDGSTGVGEISSADLGNSTIDTLSPPSTGSGQAPSAGSGQAVPEPSTLLLAFLAIVGTVCIHVAQRQCRYQTV